MSGVWQSKFFSNVESFFQYFNITYYLQFSSWETYLTIIFIIALILLIFYLCLFFFSLLNEKSTRQRASWIVQPLRMISHFFSTLLYIPIVELFLSVYKCKEDLNGNSVHYIFAEKVCWQSTHLVICILSIMILAAFLVLAGVITLLYYDNSISKFDVNSK
jgi:hypothetical protein